MMRYLIAVFVLVILGSGLKAQTVDEPVEGSVSFVTTQNIYVKFKTTENIAVGDTLFMSQDGKLIPALTVINLSSISCVCSPVINQTFAVADKILAKPKPKMIEKPIEITTPATVAILPPTAGITDSISDDKASQKTLKQNISGRASVSAYSNFSNTPADQSLRMRYTFSMNARNINDSKFSAETYISFAHKNGEWDEIQNNINKGLKIYSLAFKYDFDPNTTLLVGRKINAKISNVGAIDGVQFEKKFKALSFGLFAGTRPDYSDYSFNAKLPQFGGYLAHDYNTKTGNMQNSVAIVEQENSGKTDRRFAYFQHSNTLVKNLYFFGSIEFDLYKKEMNQDSTFTQDNAPRLSNMYVSLRYKINKQLSLSLSYSARQNVVYYESFATNIIERLLETSTLYGYSGGINFRPAKNISAGLKAGYRNRKEDPSPSTNYYGYVTFNRVPFINASATLSATILETGYLSGGIYSAGITRDIIPGKLSGGLNYKYVDYKFTTSETKLVQNMGEINLTWKVYKKLYCSVNYEGTFEKDNNYNRVYFNLTQRF